MAVLVVLIILYLVFAFFIVKLFQGTTPRIMASLFFAFIASPFIYKYVMFGVDCYMLESEQIIEKRTEVEGVLFTYNWGIDSQWPYWMVGTAGYGFADLKSGKEYDHYFWRDQRAGTGQKKIPDSTAKYEIKILKSQPRNFIIKNEFVAIDRSSQQVLGRKTILFMLTGRFTSYLNWKLHNNSDQGGLTCPGIHTTKDILGFFPTKVLIPSLRKQ